MNKKFKTLSEVYQTGNPQDVIKEEKKSFTPMSSLHNDVLLKELTVMVGDEIIGEIEPDRVDALKAALEDDRSENQRVIQALKSVVGRVTELSKVSGFLKTTKSGKAFIKLLSSLFTDNNDLYDRHQDIIGALVNHRSNNAKGLIANTLKDGSTTIDIKQDLKDVLSTNDVSLEESVFDQLFIALLQAKPDESPAVGQGEFLMSLVYDLTQMKGDAVADLVDDSGNITIEVKGNEARPGSSGASYAQKQTMNKLSELLGDSVDMKQRASIKKYASNTKSLETYISKNSKGLKLEPDFITDTIIIDGFNYEIDEQKFNEVQQLTTNFEQNGLPLGQKGQVTKTTTELFEKLKLFVFQVEQLQQQEPELGENDLIETFYNKDWGTGVQYFISHTIDKYRKVQSQENLDFIVKGLYHMRNHDKDAGNKIYQQLKQIITPEYILTSNDLYDNLDKMIGAIQIANYSHAKRFKCISFTNEGPTKAAKETLGRSYIMVVNGEDALIGQIFEELKALGNTFRVNLTIDSSPQGGNGVQLSFLG